ncbi:MAG TPA: ADP-ribosylglycohydrolase family protein [Gammaproteobacteria bacterium]|nr:ADP-ribosylglycohydrolase family protein [Gammaproteobacteria bacterium]
MLGAIAGDVIGSVYEARPIKHKEFPLFSRGSTFTDDTVLTVAAADALLSDGDYARAYQEYFARHPGRGFGASFAHWAAAGQTLAYGSYGNGSAMRVSAVAWAKGTLESVLDEAKRSAAVTHDHPEGIKGAMATAAAIFLARKGADKGAIRGYVSEAFGYALHRELDAIRPGYAFDVSCQGSVPESIICFLESEAFEDAIRNAVSLGGDADTMACISGAIAEAFYGGVPRNIEEEVRARVDGDLLAVVDRFHRRFEAPKACE